MTPLITQFRTLLAQTAVAARGFLLACGTLAAVAPAAQAVPDYRPDRTPCRGRMTSDYACG
ncbi:hypothetical protein AWV80_10275 [Cupriavidus sp. UYMU48A]|nr:hypothetical protein AWV80_10275 [Cupriavidus sp. UYMU48A]